MFVTPWKRLAPWVLLLGQESCLLYIKLDYKNLGYKIYIRIFKNHMEKTLATIIGENQSAATKNRTILHKFSPFERQLMPRQVKQQPYLNIFPFTE